ncbi:hypothetical protein KR093_009556, partial [Drosophila rubida]
NMEALPTTFDVEAKTWSGQKRNPIYDYNVSVGRIIFNSLNNWPSNVCQINDVNGESVTNSQALTWAIRIVQHLKQRGFTQSDVVGIAAKNTTYLMPLGVACLMNATPFHAVNPVLDADSIKYVLELTKPKIIFCDGLDYMKVKAATRDWNPEIFTMIDHIEGVSNIESFLEPTTTEMFYQPELLQNGGDQTMAILCSSGTTGLPKAICISNNLLLQDIVVSSIPNCRSVNSEISCYIASSLDWLSGILAMVSSTIHGCTRIISNRPFSPEYFVQLVEKYKIFYTLLPPRHLSAVAACPEATEQALSSLRLLNYGGGMASLTTLQRFQDICKSVMLNALYGMTESGCVTANVGFNNKNTAGRLLPGVQIRIVDEEGNRLSYNQVGEIYVHTELTWNGYYGNPVETRRMQDFEGWFHTGDLGYFDEQNFLYIVDRKKEILKYQGLQYWPTEIETVIAELPQVQDVCVVGVYDERQGDAAGALIVKRKGCEINEKAIVEHVAKRLTGMQKQLHAGVRFTDQLPANMNGKTVRKLALEVFVSLKDKIK